MEYLSGNAKTRLQLGGQRAMSAKLSLVIFNSTDAACSQPRGCALSKDLA
jgi:hypothetical protein